MGCGLCWFCQLEYHLVGWSIAMGVEGRERIAPFIPRREGPPLRGVFPSARVGDTNFPRVSNTTSRHPFDTLVTGMGWSCAAELKKAERNEFFTQTALVRVKSDKERPAGVTPTLKTFKFYGANIGSVFYTSVKRMNLTETDIFQILDARITQNTNTMSLYNANTWRIFEVCLNFLPHS